MNGSFETLTSFTYWSELTEDWQYNFASPNAEKKNNSPIQGTNKRSLIITVYTTYKPWSLDFLTGKLYLSMQNFKFSTPPCNFITGCILGQPRTLFCSIIREKIMDISSHGLALTRWCCTSWLSSSNQWIVWMDSKMQSHHLLKVSHIRFSMHTFSYLILKSH